MALHISHTFANCIDYIRRLYSCVFSAFDVCPCFNLFELLQRPREELPESRSELAMPIRELCLLGDLRTELIIVKEISQIAKV